MSKHEVTIRVVLESEEDHPEVLRRVNQFLDGGLVQDLFNRDVAHVSSIVVTFESSLTLKEVFQVLKNMGHDTECGSCMEVAFTGGSTGNPHSCGFVDDVEITGLEVQPPCCCVPDPVGNHRRSCTAYDPNNPHVLDKETT